MKTGYNVEGRLDVVMSSIVTSIGAYAFYSNQLTEVILPTTPLTIECFVFNDNPITKNGTYTYPDNVSLYPC